MNSFLRLSAATLALVAFTTPAWAQEAKSAEPAPEAKSAKASQSDDDLRARLRVLEEQVKALRGENKRSSRKGEQHFTDDKGDLRWGGERPSWDIGPSNTNERPKAVEAKLGGYFSLEYRGQFGRDRSETSHFDMHRFVPQLDFTIHEFVTFSTEIEFEGGGADVGFLDGNEILVEYAELEFNIMPEFKPKAGLILIPFGRYNMVHDDPMHDLMDRPFVARRVVPSAFDQPGIGAAGDFNFEGLNFHYDIALTQGYDDDFSTNGGSRGARQSFRSDDNSNKALWFRGVATPDFAALMNNEDLFASFGASINHQTIGERDFETIGYGFDWQAKWNPSDMLDGRFALTTEGEFAQIEVNRSDADGVNRLEGYYAQLGFQLRPWNDGDWNDWLRESGYLAVTLRYEGNDLDDRQQGGGVRDDRQAFTFGFAFRPFLKTVIRSEWKTINSSGRPDDEADRFVFSISTYF